MAQRLGSIVALLFGIATVGIERPNEGATLDADSRHDDVVFVGTVVEVGPPAGVGCGIAMATQSVTYRIDARLVQPDGLMLDEIIVNHEVCEVGANVEAGRGGLRLRSSRFFVGAKLLVTSRCDGAQCDRLFASKHQVGVATPLIVAALESSAHFFGDARTIEDARALVRTP